MRRSGHSRGPHTFTTHCPLSLLAFGTAPFDLQDMSRRRKGCNSGDLVDQDRHCLFVSGRNVDVVNCATPDTDEMVVVTGEPIPPVRNELCLWCRNVASQPLSPREPPGCDKERTTGHHR